MKLLSLLFALWVQLVAVQASSGLIDRATVYIQPVSTVETPATPLVEIEYNPSTLQAELVSFEAPELSSDNKLVRIGIYDASTSTWKSSTTITSVKSFSKGYAPTFVLSLDPQGAILGVACKSGKIDAGQTRDFGPKVKVSKSSKGKQPELNRPVILSPEGKLEQPVPEKTMLQKYWWVALGLLMLVMTSGGGGE